MTSSDLPHYTPFRYRPINPAMFFSRNYSPIRRSRRQWINTSVQVFSNSMQFSAVGINLSDGGMGFFAVVNLRVGSQVEIEFTPPKTKHPVRASAAIRHRALYLYGVEFVDSASEPNQSRLSVQSPSTRLP